MEIARWHGHTFQVSSNIIMGFTDLTLKTSCETEDKTKNKQKYVARKNGNPAEMTLTAILNAHAGVKVEQEMRAFLDDATAGAKDYFYIGSKKLYTHEMMLVSANVTETEMIPGKWVSCKIALTLKQTGTGGSSSSGSSGSSSGGSGSSGGGGSSGGTVKQSVYSTTPKQTASSTTAVKNIVKAAGGIVGTVGALSSGAALTNLLNKKAVSSSANATIDRIVSAAKQTTTQKKTVSAAKATVGGGGKYIAISR